MTISEQGPLNCCFKPLTKLNMFYSHECISHSDANLDIENTNLDFFSILSSIIRCIFYSAQLSMQRVSQKKKCMLK